ncbi:hypothetical protein M422DRAFT_187210, partial [Sphaerobolus stellatus SS14]
QYHRWQDEIVPQLIRPYMELLQLTKNGQDTIDGGFGEHVGCSCWQRGYNMCDIRLEETRLQYCKCQPAAVTLIKQGLFACSPIQPSIAFDIGLLE